jgi:hypothetical protein
MATKKGNALLITDFEMVEMEFGLIKLRRNEKDNELRCNKSLAVNLLNALLKK